MTRIVWLVLLLTTTLSLPQSNPVRSRPQADTKTQARILDQYGKLPLSFEANRGQTDPRVKFLSRADGYTLFLTGDEAVLALSGKSGKTAPRAHGHDSKSNIAGPKDTGILSMKLRKANPVAKVTGSNELKATSNYFIGNDPSKWQTNVPSYSKVKYKDIYSGIDLIYYGNQRQLEYDFIVAPRADPDQIGFDISGADQIRRNPNGELVVKLAGSEIRWQRPVAYQQENGTRHLISARYAISNGNRVKFVVGQYDPRTALYIDPLIYSTYLGGSGGDAGFGIAVDSSDNAYVTGYTASTDFPTMNPSQSGNAGSSDAFVTKLNPTGSALVYSTYLGGSNVDQGTGIAVDSTGNVYVTGNTESTNFPTTPSALQTMCGGTCLGNAFVAKIDSLGSALIYSTYLGGSGDGNSGDESAGIAVDGSGNAYVTGQTTSIDFPVTPGAFQTNCNFYNYNICAFVSKLNGSGSLLAYSSYLGGTNGNSDIGSAIAVDSSSNAYVTGFTDSTNFPVTPGAFQTICNSCPESGDAFVTKLNAAGSELVYSTFIGGYSADWGLGIAVDTVGNAYVAGVTYSSNFPTRSPLQSKFGGGPSDAFVAKFDATGSSLIYSTFLGGRHSDQAMGIALDSSGGAYVTGYTLSTNFPLANPFQKKNGGNYGAFVSRIASDGTALASSTYLGGSGLDTGAGIAVDTAGNAYVTGGTASTDFPVTPGAFQTVCNGGSGCEDSADAFVTKIQMSAATTTALSSSPNPSSYGEIVTFTAVITSVAGAPPDGENVTFMKGKTVLGTGTLSSGSASFTTSTLKVGTNSVKATYGGDPNFAASASKVVKQVVSK